MTAAFAIEVERVTKRYPKVRGWREIVAAPRAREWTEALRGVTLRVERGTVHGLLGRNGAGKTTLLKILATLVLPSSGRARIAGVDVTEAPDAARRSLGLVTAEERSFYWRLSGLDNLLFFAALHDLQGAERKRRTDELLEAVGLSDSDARRPFREYSSGMKQRLAIARGLLANPEIVLMDEPTRALDPPAAAWIRSFVRERLVKERGVTVVLATHDLLEAETTCDRLSLVDDGRIVAEGTPAKLKAPLGRATRTRITLIDCDDAKLHRLIAAGALPPDVLPTSIAGRAEIHVAGGPEDIARHVSALAAAGAQVAAVEPEEGDLKDLFERAGLSAERRREGAP